MQQGEFNECNRGGSTVIQEVLGRAQGSSLAEIAPGVLDRPGIYCVGVSIFPALTLILQVVGGVFRHLPPKISFDHVRSKIEAAGQDLQT